MGLVCITKITSTGILAKACRGASHHVLYWQMKVFAGADGGMPLRVNKQPVCLAFADVRASVTWRARWLCASTDVANSGV